MEINQDEFFVHYDKIKKTLNEIKVLINDRTKCIAKNEPIQEIDNSIKNKFIIIDQNSAIIKLVLENYSKKPSISMNEINRRTQLFAELQNSENIIKNQFNTSFIHTKLNKPNLLEMNKYTPYEIKPSNENISQLAQEHISKQDDTFETYIGIVKKIKNKGREIGNEMDSHTPLIDKMEKNIDRVDEKLQRTENKLKKFLERTSDTVIWKVIIAEMVILLLFILI